MRKYTIKVSGPFDVLTESISSNRPKGRKECALLAILALTEGHRQSRKWLQGKLWSDRGDQQAAGSLRHALSNLRKLFADTPEAIQANRLDIWLNESHFELDDIAKAKLRLGEDLLQGIDIQDPAFRYWLRRKRLEFQAPTVSQSIAQTATHAPVSRQMFFDADHSCNNEGRRDEFAYRLLDALIDRTRNLSSSSLYDCRETGVTKNATGPHDLKIVVRVIGSQNNGVATASVSNSFGKILWQCRRELRLLNARSTKNREHEFVQLFQDFLLSNEETLRYSAPEQLLADVNAFKAFRGIVCPGSVAIREMEQCARFAAEAMPTGFNLALTGMGQLFLLGERISPIVSVCEVVEKFQQALRKDPSNPLVRSFAGHASSYLLRDINRGLALTSDAVEISPGNAICWGYYGLSCAYAGKYQTAKKAASNFRRLAKYSLVQPVSESYSCFINLLAGELPDAVNFGESAIVGIPNFRPATMDLAAAYAHLGQLDKGRKLLHRLKDREPDLSIDMFRCPDYPIVNTEHRKIVVNGMKALGLN